MSLITVDKKIETKLSNSFSKINSADSDTLEELVAVIEKYGRETGISEKKLLKKSPFSNT